MRTRFEVVATVLAVAVFGTGGLEAQAPDAIYADLFDQVASRAGSGSLALLAPLRSYGDEVVGGRVAAGALTAIRARGVAVLERLGDATTCPTDGRPGRCTLADTARAVVQFGEAAVVGDQATIDVAIYRATASKRQPIHIEVYRVTATRHPERGWLADKWTLLRIS